MSHSLDLAVFKPFMFWVWIAIVGTIIAFGLLLKLMSRWEQEGIESSSVFVLTFGAFCQQPAPGRISLSSTRCLLFFLFTISMIMCNFYTSTVVSTIVNVRPETSIKTKEDLANSDMPVGFQDGPTIRGFFIVSKSKSFSRVTRWTIIHYFQSKSKGADFVSFIERKLKTADGSFESFLMGAKEGFRRVKEEHFAFHCGATTAFSIIPKLFDQRQICDIRSIVFQPHTKNGLIVKKNAPFRERLAINWHWTVEIGIAYRHVRYWEGRKPACTSDCHFKGIGPRYVSPLLLLLLLAFAFSIILLICEVIAGRIRKNK